MGFYFNNKGTFSFKIKGNIPSNFGDKFIEFLMNEKFEKFRFTEGAKGNEYNLTFTYTDNCTIEDVKKHIDWSVFSNIQKYGYTDTSTIDEKDFDIENFCKFEYELNMMQERQRYYIIFKR